jgi:hypothetical protein
MKALLRTGGAGASTAKLLPLYGMLLTLVVIEPKRCNLPYTRHRRNTDRAETRCLGAGVSGGSAPRAVIAIAPRHHYWHCADLRNGHLRPSVMATLPLSRLILKEPKDSSAGVAQERGAIVARQFASRRRRVSSGAITALELDQMLSDRAVPTSANTCRVPSGRECECSAARLQ